MARFQKHTLMPVSEDLGLAYLASAIDENQHPLFIFDQNMTNKSDDEMIEEIIAFKPNVIGFTTCNDTLSRIMTLASVLKKYLSDCHIVFGDQAASLYADQIFQNCDSVDSICIGEGEGTIVDLISALDSHGDIANIPGLYCKNSSSSNFRSRTKISDISKIRWPMRYLLLALTRNEKNVREVSILGSRGCGFSCSFCASDFLERMGEGRIWRGRSPSEIVDEIEYLYDKYGVKRFNFLDELWTGPSTASNKHRAFEFCNELKKRNLDIRFRFSTRVDFFDIPGDAEILVALRENGLEELFVGVENGQDKTLKLYGKHISRKQIEALLNFLFEMDILYRIGFIMFHPYVTKEDLINNGEFLSLIRCNHLMENFFSSITLYKGATLSDHVRNSGLITGEIQWRSFNYSFENPEIPRIFCLRNKAFVNIPTTIDTHVFSIYKNLWHKREGEGKDKAEKFRQTIGEYYARLWDMILHHEPDEDDFIEFVRNVENAMDDAIEKYSVKKCNPIGYF